MTDRELWEQIRQLKEEPVPKFDNYFELWEYFFRGFRDLLPPKVQGAFMAVCKAYAEEAARITSQGQDDDWPDQIDR